MARETDTPAARRSKLSGWKVHLANGLRVIAEVDIPRQLSGTMPLKHFALAMMLSQAVLLASPLRSGSKAERAAKRDPWASSAGYMASFLRNSRNLAYVSALVIAYARATQANEESGSYYAQPQLRALTDGLFFYLAHGYYASLGYHLTVGDWKTIAFCFYAAGVMLTKERRPPDEAKNVRDSSRTKSTLMDYLGVLFAELKKVVKQAREAFQDEFLMAILLLLAMDAGREGMNKDTFVGWLRFMHVGAIGLEYYGRNPSHAHPDAHANLAFCRLAAEVLAHFASFGGFAMHFLTLFFLTAAESQSQSSVQPTSSDATQAALAHVQAALQKISGSECGRLQAVAKQSLVSRTSE